MMQKILLVLTGALIFVLQLTAQTIRGTYAIKNKATGMVLRVKDASNKNGTPLVSYSPVNWKCVTWDFRNVEGNSYQLSNLFTGKTFQARGAVEDGVVMEEQPLEALKSAQLYEFIPAENKTYLIRMKGTELYLTPVDESGESNSAIVLAARKKGKLQQWVLEEQHPTM